HRHPGVRDDAIGTADGLLWVGGETDSPTLRLRPVEHALRRPELGRASEVEGEIEAHRRMHPAHRDVVTVTAPGNDFASGRSFMLLERHHVRHELARMARVCEAVDHRYGRVLRH